MPFDSDQGWEEVVVKQDQSSEGDSEMKISLPSMPSLYISSFLFKACEEIHKVGGHVLDKTILQQFARKLLEKVSIYQAQVLHITKSFTASYVFSSSCLEPS